MGIKVNLKNVRIGWVNVFEKAADSVNQQGQPVKGKYQLTAYLDKNDPQISKLDATVLEVLTEGMKSAKAAEKWMDKNYGFGNHADKCAIRDLAERDKPIEGLEEGLYFKATSQKRPVIMTSAGERQGSERGLTIDGDDIEGKEVYAGCYANISVEIYWYDAYKTLLVNLLGVRFREDGEAFGGAGEVATDSDLDDDDDDKPSRPKRRPSRDEDDEELPRRKRRSYEDDEE
ncbi:TPA: ssDNA-binding protein [Salmonella enterica subsp. enterica serovar Saintpaul]